MKLISSRLVYSELSEPHGKRFHELVTDSHIKRYLFDGETLALSWAQAAVQDSQNLFEKRKVGIMETLPEIGKRTIRRSGLEIKKAEEQEEKKRMDQEKEWEIPAFLRRVKYKS